MINKIKLFFTILNYRTFGRIKREIAYRKRLKAMRDRDPYIY